ncbi:MAG TPA: alpha/beta hydrolase [Gemmatimonadaceae bacterium]
MIREHHADTPARRIRYLEAGAGWPVLLIHAFPLSADMWRAQLQSVPDGWRFIAPDVHGFGGEIPGPTAEPTMDDFAGDVEALLNVLEIETGVIGGISMGAYVLFALFRRAPERFSGMVLADTRAQADSPEGRQARRAMSELIRRDGPAAVADEMMPKLLGEATRRERPEVAAEVRRLILGNTPAGLDGAIHAMMTRPDSTPDLERVSVPTLVIVGDEDVLTPVADSEALHRGIERSQLVVLPRVGHLTCLEAPDEFSRALSNFLASNI